MVEDWFMASLGRLLLALAEDDRQEVGMVSQLGETRWIIGDDENFPVQIEILVPEKNILLYATGIRSGGQPVLAPMMETLFLERLYGHSLGSYGISVGPVTLTTYQRIALSGQFNMGKLVTSIICHRMLMECYLNADTDISDDGWLLENPALSDAPILPHRH